ncbi:hypothetical protein A3Q56_04940 [Intoshia linei]|uniref:BEACH-type PH domain-containing protein n=1 Tax=Intoshia linei TaxID=1819745 RepID=A0A177B1G6_9BILA|nr:hypothetical protein A3Q56_04940 [Intoshia linei]
MSKNKKESGDTSIYSDSTSTYIESDAYSETDLNALNIDHNNENTDYDPLEGPNEPVVSQVHIDSCTDNKDINQNDNNNISIDGVDSVAAVPSVASAVSVALVCSIGKDNSLDKKINLPKIDNCKSQEINNVKLDDKKQEPKNTCLPSSTNVEYPNISDTFNMSDDLKASFLSQLNELVDGAFDMNDNYEPHSPKSIISYFDSIQKVPNVLSIALLSMFTDIIAKSSQTLKMCCDVNIDITIINNLKFIKDEKITNGYIKILSHVLAYSLTIVKLSCIIKLLSPIEGNLSKNALHLLRTFPIIFSSKQPSHYFHFPKNYKCCSIDMPPITKWNQNSGWTFHCWIKLDNSIKFVENSEKFYIFSRWKTSNITLYVNGECILCSQNSWLISTVQEYDNCCIGNNSIREAAFCGQLGTVYMFNEALSGSYVQAIYSLGRDYKGSFVSESELRSFNNSAPVIYDNLLSRHLVFCYSPSNCENSLCLENTIHYEPSSNFFNNAVTHAYLKCGIKSISRNLPLSCFHSIGGIQIIYPLFELLKLKESMELAAKYNIAEYLMKFIVNFILTSDEALHSFVQTNGFTILSVVLTESNVKYFLTNSVLDCLFEIHEYISRTCASWIIDSFVDSFFLNPNLWIYASSEIQVNLYNYMYRVSIPYALHNSSISRHDHYVRQILYMLRFYYWVTEPEFGSDEVIKCNAQERPSIENLQEIRSILLKCALEFISSSKPHNNDIQTLVNYLLLVKEDDNVHDVLILYVRLMCTHPEIGVPSFSNKNVIEVVVKLLESKDAMIRNNTLKLFGYFLMYSSEERKFVTFQKHNICSLIAEKLMTNLTFLNIKVYNVLYEILIDVITPFVSMEKHPTIMKNARLQNPDIIITIISCIGKSEHCSELLDVVIIFLEDLYRLVVKSGINRRLILQLTVWQNWVYSLSFLRPSCDKENKINELIVDIIIVLLHHALKYENCGWRVWVDTISIIHSIDSYNEFKLMRSEINNRSNSGVGAVAFRNNSTSYDKIESSIYSHDTDLSTHSNENLEDYNDLGKDQKDESLNNLENLNLNDNVRKGDGDGENKVDDTYEIEKEKEKLDKKMGIDNNDKADKAVYFDEHKQNPSFRIPPFKWSKIQHTLFEKLLDVIENDIKPLDESQSFTDLEVTYMVNVVQVLTQLVDIFSYSCGGIIGLLGISSTGNASVELIDLGSETLKTRHAVSLILRFSKILDICALNNAIYLPSLEVEKHLPKGSISRLMLRLAVLSAMRNYFECYFKRENIDISNQQSQIIDKQLVVLFEMANTKMYDNVLDIHQLLQKSDYDRIKIILNKNISDVKTTQGLVLSTLYFLSVLIVSRYRDILEDNAHTPKKENSGDNEKEKFKKKSENVYEIDSTSATSTQIKNENPTTQNTFDLNVEKNDSNSFSNKENPETPISGHIQMLSSTMKSIQLLKCENENVEKLPKTVTIEVESNQDKDEALHEKILNSLSSAVKLIKYLFQTHKNFLIRTLIGSHGQDIYTPAAHCFEDSTSLVQIVMLICSQEWQTSLLTHAGLSFIELANEGRMLSYAVQDHIIRVATEAEFIINKISAENVEKHAVFNKKFNKSFHLSKNQELTIEYMVSSYRQQNFNMVHNQIEFLRIFFEDRYSNVNNERGSKKFFYLSLHQDNSRRRYKFERNIYGSSHKEANIFFNKNRENAKSGFYPTLDIKNVDTNVFKNSNSDNTSSGEFVNDPNSIISITESVNQQAGKRNCSTSLSNVDTYSIENSLFIQRELSSANVILQNDCHMMSYGLTLKGTMYITNSCLYFDIDVKALKELKEDDFYNRKVFYIFLYILFIIYLNNFNKFTWCM